MIQINNSSTNPFLNLALEEYLLKQKDLKEKILILWRNEPAVVIGKNQNAYGEINLPFVEKNQIHVVRRMSGGGAVYHDLGNLNFTILEPEDHRQNQMRVFSAPIIRCLRKYGIRAEFSGRNDILVEGEKVSGSAQYFWKNRVLCHGTLLYATDLKKLSNSLKVDKRKIRAKGIASVRSRIENIETFMAKKISLEEFAEVLAETFFEEVGEKRCVVDLSEKDHEKIAALKKAKYETWQWNFGQSPAIDQVREERVRAGQIAVAVKAEGGIIKSFKITGDFFERNPIEVLEERLTGQRFEKKEIEAVLRTIPVSEYIFDLSNEELIQILFS
ncbi:Lipoate-protein ligase LplJ [Blautia hydrogenotrophica]|nr:Lipoate-protein ligase LplJ [Blautia hydrogenotrophica]SCI14319.1 Lipoate-protein ligase LplJ [uncultured Blautia sp.]